jgi:hypothetical protein
MKNAILLGVLLLPLLCHASTAQMDGNDLLEKCRPWWMDTNNQPFSMTEALNTGFCAGYVAGVTDVEAVWSGVEKGTSKATHYCMPKEATNKQVLRILKKWLDNNPDKLHLRADTIIHMALLAAFPCK